MPQSESVRTRQLCLVARRCGAQLGDVLGTGGAAIDVCHVVGAELAGRTAVEVTESARPLTSDWYVGGTVGAQIARRPSATVFLPSSIQVRDGDGQSTGTAVKLHVYKKDQRCSIKMLDEITSEDETGATAISLASLAGSTAAGPRGACKVSVMP